MSLSPPRRFLRLSTAAAGAPLRGGSGHGLCGAPRRCLSGLGTQRDLRAVAEERPERAQRGRTTVAVQAMTVEADSASTFIHYIHFHYYSDFDLSFTIYLSGIHCIHSHSFTIYSRFIHYISITADPCEVVSGILYL